MREELRLLMRLMPAGVRRQISMHRRLARIEKLLDARERREVEVKRRSEKVEKSSDDVRARIGISPCAALSPTGLLRGARVMFPWRDLGEKAVLRGSLSG